MFPYWPFGPETETLGLSLLVLAEQGSDFSVRGSLSSFESSNCSASSGILSSNSIVSQMPVPSRNRLTSLSLNSSLAFRKLTFLLPTSFFSLVTKRSMFSFQSGFIKIGSGRSSIIRWEVRLSAQIRLVFSGDRVCIVPIEKSAPMGLRCRFVLQAEADWWSCTGQPIILRFSSHFIFPGTAPQKNDLHSTGVASLIRVPPRNQRKHCTKFVSEEIACQARCLYRPNQFCFSKPQRGGGAGGGARPRSGGAAAPLGYATDGGDMEVN